MSINTPITEKRPETTDATSSSSFTKFQSTPPSALPRQVSFHGLNDTAPFPQDETHGSEVHPASIQAPIANPLTPEKVRKKRWHGDDDEVSLEHSHHFHMNLALKERVKHFTWTWFCMTMATGGIANVLYSIPDPYRFNGLWTIGCIVFLFNIFLFLFNVVMISMRFYSFPRTFTASFLHPTESLFIPAAIISFGTIMINVTQYGVGTQTGDWLMHGMVVVYWIYCASAVLLSSGIYLVMWSTTTFTIAQMTPVWIFPAYPLLIIGPFASNLSRKLPADEALTIILGGFILQGIGFLVSLMIYSAYMYRLMTQKLPQEGLRPGMFISVGPSGFTISGLIGMGSQMPRVVGTDFMGPGMGKFAGEVSLILANWAGMWLWGLAMWFFFVSVAAHFSSVAHHRMHFAMNWYSFVFPNTALTTATFAVGTALNKNRGFYIVGLCLTVALLLMWLFVFSMMIRAVYLKHILWPQMQEDRDEGGWGKDAKRKKKELVRQESFFNHLFNSTPRHSVVTSPVEGARTPVGPKTEFELTRQKETDKELKGEAGWSRWAGMGRNRTRSRGRSRGSDQGIVAFPRDVQPPLTRIQKLEKHVNPV